MSYEEEEGDGFPRDRLEVERLYFEQSSDQFFWTPDGIGCHWYETLTEAMEDTGAFDQTIIQIEKLRDW